MEIAIGIGGRDVDEAVAQVEQAAADGFRSVWMSNIFGLDAITLAAVAGRTVPEIRLGTAVVPIAPRHPHAMAQQAMTAHDAVGGRFTLGIGLSHQIVIESMFGLSYERPAAQMREYLAVLLPLLREGTASFDGTYHRVHATLERSGDPVGPPVLIAAMAPRMLRLAGAAADGTILWLTGRRTIAEHVAPRITAAAEEAGRPAPRVVCSLPVAVTPDPDAARQRVAKTWELYGSLPSYRAMLDKEGAEGPADVAVVGDEATVEAELRRYAEAGVTEFSAVRVGDRETVERTTAVLRSML